jgi:hypothetical protein
MNLISILYSVQCIFTASTSFNDYFAQSCHIFIKAFSPLKRFLGSESVEGHSGGGGEWTVENLYICARLSRNPIIGAVPH